MRKCLTFVVSLVGLFILTGCATQIGSFLNDASREEAVYVEDAAGKRIFHAFTLNQSADRRNTFFFPSGPAAGEKELVGPNTVLAGTYAIACAEQPPDAAIGYAYSESLSVGISKNPTDQTVKKAEGDAKVIPVATPLVARDAVVDMIRVAFFQNCLALASRAITAKQFYYGHKELIEAVKLQATQARIK